MLVRKILLIEVKGIPASVLRCGRKGGIAMADNQLSIFDALKYLKDASEKLSPFFLADGVECRTAKQVSDEICDAAQSISHAAEIIRIVCEIDSARELLQKQKVE